MCELGQPCLQVACSGQVLVNYAAWADISAPRFPFVLPFGALARALAQAQEETVPDA